MSEEFKVVINKNDLRKPFDAVRFMQETEELNFANAVQAMQENAGLLGFYSTQAAYWDRVVSDLKLDIKIEESRAGAEARATLAKATVAAVEEVVAASPNCHALNKAMNKAKEQQALYVAAVGAINERGWNVRSYKARESAEMDQAGIRTTDNSTVRTREQRDAVLRSPSNT